MKMPTLFAMVLLLSACASPEKSRQQLYLEADRLSGGATTRGGELELNVLEIPSRGLAADLLEVAALKVRGNPKVRGFLQEVEASEDPRVLLISKSPALEQGCHRQRYPWPVIAEAGLHLRRRRSRAGADARTHRGRGGALHRAGDALTGAAALAFSGWRRRAAECECCSPASACA